jgi:myo-inositol 2-dehydrogenase / D-chiro-inositol 1-dehydrogenase
MTKPVPPTKPSRREFIQKSSAIAAGGAALVGMQANIARAAHAFGSDEIKIGLIGCGGRGTGAVIDALHTKGGGLKLVAIGDAFPDRVKGAAQRLKNQFADNVDLPEDRQYVGFDAYKKVLDSSCNIVFMATPPGFRPLHFAAAVAAKKHVFMEKPIAVDAQGVRKILEANEDAKKHNLAVAVGLQRRHERRYMATVKAIQDGAVGDIILARAYWNGNRPWFKNRDANWTELEYQMRNWYQFNWLCGDHITEQHIHNLDVINWIMNDYPKSAQGQGGREFYRGEGVHGEIYDHHFVEFTYANGAKLLSQCRHIPGCDNPVSEHIHGTKGYSDVSGAKIFDHSGKVLHDFSKEGGGGHQQEHHDLFADLRAGRIPNEAEYGAKSSMTAVLGRMATGGGKQIDWDKALSNGIDCAPIDWLAGLKSFDDKAPVQPLADGTYAAAVPGKTKMIS